MENLLHLKLKIRNKMKEVEQELLKYVNETKTVSLSELTNVLDGNLLPEQTIGRVKVGDIISETRVINLDTRLAEYMLLRNDNNRPVSQTAVAKYAKAMVSGEWSWDGAAIAFDRHGRILNGQHRLLAVIKSGASIPMAISTGYDSSVFATMDIVNTRKAADALAIKGVPNATLMARTVMFVHKFGQGVIGINASSPDRNGVNAKDGLSVNQILDIVDTDVLFTDAIAFYERVKPWVQPSGLIGPQVITGFHYLLTKANKDLDSQEAEVFITSLISGEGMVLNSPLFHLRNRLVNSKMGLLKSKILTFGNSIKLIIFGWNKQKEGKAIKQLSVPKDLPKIK